MRAPHQPFIKWYPTDWRADPRLRMCSLAARGLWIELIGYMHEGEPYGHLTINDVAPSIEDIAALVGRPLTEVRKAMAELEHRQVYSTDALQGTPYSRRMVRDKAKADQDRRNGKGGGNPKLTGEDKGGVNPPDKAHIPEARSQKPEPEKETRVPALVEDGWPEDFRDQFWARYPNKVGKPKALAKLESARKCGVSWQAIIAGLDRYIRGKPADRAWLNPETFLNQERWADQPATVSTGPPRGGSQGFESLFQQPDFTHEKPANRTAYDLDLTANRTG